MAKGFSLSVSGLDKLRDKLGKLPDTVRRQVTAVMENTAKEFVSRAKKDAPADTGSLRNQITYERIGDEGFQIVSSSFQAGYVEFGTKSKFQPIPGFEAEAASIQGATGGTKEQMRTNIQQWVRRKGIRFSGKTAEQTAEIIIWSILTKGIAPHPYFFKQVEPAQRQLQIDLNALVID